MSKEALHVNLVERFINGLKLKQVAELPLHEDVSLHSPLRPGHVISGKSQMQQFLSKLLPKLPITDAIIEKHIAHNNCVCTLWSLHLNEITIPIFDYLELQNNLIIVVRPYFDPAPLKKMLD